jgi:hypothetical protein
MSDDRRGSRGGDYRAARAGAALALTIAIFVVLVIDALSADYEASPVTLGVLATLIAGLLAVDLPDLLRPGK